MAVMRGSEVLRSVVVGDGKTTKSGVRAGQPARPAALLSHELEATLRWCERENLVLRFISVAAGPGSFTGLRVGVTTAKVLAYARSIPLVAVDSLSAMAASYFATHPDAPRVLVAIDAYRKMVFTCMQQNEQREGAGLIIDRTEILTAEQWHVRLRDCSGDVDLIGEPKVFADDRDRFVEISEPLAVGVGRCGQIRAIAGQWVDVMSLSPNYFRGSAAEEKFKTPGP